MSKLYCDSVLLPDGWAAGVVIDIAEGGSIAAVDVGADPLGCVRAAGPVVPGMPNLHSHAFQRAMAGLAEVAGPAEDSFWTWREVMYGFVGRLTPEDVEIIAAQLYVDMLKAGYTAVGEFHYLHHSPCGAPYDDPAELSRRVMAAAQRSGIGLTHLPVLYAHGGFGGAEASARQARFLHDGPHFLALVERLRDDSAGDPQIAVGIAPHSLRAVTPELLSEVVDGFTAMDPRGAIHIHIAEQTGEVDDCVAWSGQRPVEWLLDHAPVDRRWCLVHATHVTEDETARLAASGAVVGLCPTTEANLGDGLFPAPAYLGRSGIFGVGSDSHISVSVAEELRWLEYGQRLVHRRRNLLAGGPGHSTGRRLYDGALRGGAQALGRPIGAIAPDNRADLIVLDPDAPSLAGKAGDTLLDAWLFAAGDAAVRDVMVGGRFVVEAGRHAEEQEIATAYRATLRRLTA